MLDTMVEETAEDWMIDPLPEEETVNLTRLEAQVIAKSSKLADGAQGSKPAAGDQAQPPGSLAPNFHLPGTDSIGSWGSKLHTIAGNNDLNSLTGKTTLTSSSSTIAETRMLQMESFIQTQHKDMNNMKSMFNSLMENIGSKSTAGKPRLKRTQTQALRLLAVLRLEHHWPSPGVHRRKYSMEGGCRWV